MQIHECRTIFQDEFLVGGQSLTPPAGPRPRAHKPGEGRKLSSEDFERPCRPVAAFAPLANSFHTRNYRLERRASRGRGLLESDANNRLAWHSRLHSHEPNHQASSNPKWKSAPGKWCGWSCAIPVIHRCRISDIHRRDGSDAPRVDQAVRCDEVDLAARSTDIR
jgi:hypothetical protein